MRAVLRAAAWCAALTASAAAPVLGGAPACGGGAEPGACARLERLLGRAKLSLDREADWEARALLIEARDIAPAEPRVLSLLGEAQWRLGARADASASWELAVPLERDRAKRLELLRRLRRARAGADPLRADAPRPAAPKAAAPDPAQLERLYRQGLDHYARRESERARSAFLRILELDPGEPRALRALERMRRRGR